MGEEYMGPERRADFCIDHGSCKEKVANVISETKQQWKIITTMNTKLNLILGGILISPFIVTLITLLIKVK